MRSLIRTLASTARPIPSTIPAIPGKVNVAPRRLKALKVRITFSMSARSAMRPHPPYRTNMKATTRTKPARPV
jgi:hypothetical protein